MTLAACDDLFDDFAFHDLVPQRVHLALLLHPCTDASLGHVALLGDQRDLRIVIRFLCVDLFLFGDLLEDEVFTKRGFSRCLSILL